jgi:hypothetical protein
MRHMAAYLRTAAKTDWAPPILQHVYEQSRQPSIDIDNLTHLQHDAQEVCIQLQLQLLLLRRLLLLLLLCLRRLWRLLPMHLLLLLLLLLRPWLLLRNSGCGCGRHSRGSPGHERGEGRGIGGGSGWHIRALCRCLEAVVAAGQQMEQ